MTGGAVRVARVYDPVGERDGARLLVDRVWPRGIAKADLDHDAWLPEVAPSPALRRWFGHEPARWAAFQERYQAELDANPAAVERCLEWCRKGPVTLLFAARDREHNQAVVLCRYLEERR
jgi:uncharacterized protein YeaO (DUF488 family)